MQDFTGQKPLDYYSSVSMGDVPGQEAQSVLGTNPNVSATEEDLWDVGGSLVYPTAAETWEIVSDNTADTSAGTGARTVLVQCLDDEYNELDEILTLNGTTPVTFVGTDAFRFRRALVLTAGSGNINAGNITIRVASAGANRGRVLAGNGNSLDGHYTVPAGKTAFLVFVYSNINKNDDGEVMLKSTLGDAGIFSIRFPLSLYQNSVVSPVSLAPSFPEKSDLNLVATATDGDAKISVALQFIVRDNA